MKKTSSIKTISILRPPSLYGGFLLYIYPIALVKKPLELTTDLAFVTGKHWNDLILRFLLILNLPC